MKLHVLNLPLPPSLVVDGMVSCPKKGWAGMARDACCAEQARCGLGCGFGCNRGVAALQAQKEHRAQDRREEKIREQVRQRHAEYYRKWGLLPSQTRAGRGTLTGRPRGRPRRIREPRPGGIDFSR